ncbi:MAG: TVP38/TMEM64 family protein [Deltaproteobacteria bacterium]|nr:TVP38/TMEM64 family protein [Deltaproteobacteria bacterium]
MHPPLILTRGGMNNKLLARLIILSSALAAAVFLFVHYDIYVYFIDRKKAIDLVTSFGPMSVAIFIFLQIIQVLIAPFPGEVTGFIGGYLYGITWGTIYSTIGLSIGSWLAFILSRAFGLPFVEKFISQKIINQYDHFMEHKGMLVSFLLFLIPGFPKDALCYILGLSHMDVRAFIVIATVGRLLGTIMLSIQGSFVRNNQDMAFFIFLGVSGIIFLVGYFFGKSWLKKIKEKHDSQRKLHSD